MISGRTKALLIGSALPLLAHAVILLWIVLVPHFDQLIGKGSSFHIFRFHLLPWLEVCVVMLGAALISVLFDKAVIRKR